MKGYEFVGFMLPSYINGKSIVLYRNKSAGTYIVTHETTGSKVLSSREVAGDLDLEELNDDVCNALKYRGEGAAYDTAVAYING